MKKATQTTACWLSWMFFFLFGFTSWGVDPQNRLHLENLEWLLPQDPEAWLLKKLPEVRLLDPSECDVAFEKKTSAEGHHRATWTSLAINFFLYGEYLKSQEALQQGLLEESLSLETFNFLGALIAEREARWGRAIEHWQFLKDEWGLNENADWAVYYQFRCAMALRKPLLAGSLLQQVQETQLPPYLKWLTQGVYDYWTGSRLDARIHLVKSYRENPSVPHVFMGLALLTSEEENQEDAVGWLKKAFLYLPSYERERVIKVDAWKTIADTNVAFTLTIPEDPVHQAVRQQQPDRIFPALETAYLNAYAYSLFISESLELQLYTPFTAPVGMLFPYEREEQEKDGD